MHELGIMANVLDIALEYAEQNDVKKIRAINLEIGELSDIVPKIAQDFFGFIARDTIAENAILKIETIPARIRCRDCGTENDLDMDRPIYTCIECGSKSLQLISGREYRIASIEVE
ncbi:MAG: hydrogenase maturation nickel metallochaperone HypA [Syntrophomonadaceae bacterium]